MKATVEILSETFRCVFSMINRSINVILTQHVVMFPYICLYNKVMLN